MGLEFKNFSIKRVLRIILFYFFFIMDIFFLVFLVVGYLVVECF